MYGIICINQHQLTHLIFLCPTAILPVMLISIRLNFINIYIRMQKLDEYNSHNESQNLWGFIHLTLMDCAWDFVMELCRFCKQVHIIKITDLWWISRI